MYNRPNAYQEVAVQTSSSTKLVVMLYEGSIRFLRQSTAAIQAKDFDRKRESIDRAVAIVAHLQSTLDQRGGEVAIELDRLYTYITGRILEGSGKLEVAPIEEAIKLLTTLLSGWQQLANKEQEQHIPAALLGQQVPSGRFELHA